MESTTIIKTEVMKPIFLKAGIPLALSVAGFTYARIISRRRMVAKSPSLEIKVSSIETMDSHGGFIDDEEDSCDQNSNLLGSAESLDGHDKVVVQEEILGLKTRIEELQRKEWELARQLLFYNDMREQGSVLMELKNMLSLETTRVEFLDREISSLEAERQRSVNFLMEYVKILEQLESVKMENGLLERKVKNLSRKTKEQSRVIREKNSKIGAAEKEILRCHDTLDTRTNVIKQLEDEVKELQIIVNELEEEKNELLTKLKSVQDSASSVSKIEAEGDVTMEDYNQLVHELDQLNEDHAAQITELINLRWTNACLRHELMRSHEQQQNHQQQSEEKQNYLDLELEESGENKDCGMDHRGDSSIFDCSSDHTPLGAASSHPYSKRKRLLHKLKKWVEGSENMKFKLDDKEKHETRCFGRLSVSEDAEEHLLIHARKSCSSA